MRIALGIEYDGSSYFGWQRQKDVDSVQAQLELTLSKIANEPIQVQCAGRTDSGVHATGQVVHFETNSERSLTAWTLGVNANLPDTIAVCWAKEVDDEFHARFSATARRYRYIIYNDRLRLGIHRHGVSHYHGDMNESLMHEAAQALIGEHDFTSFRAVQCQSATPFRNVHRIQVTRRGKFIIVDIAANAFLHHMVRNIVGSLLEIGLGKQPVNWMQTLLDLKDRKHAAATSKAAGLYLVHVTYPEIFGLPKAPMGPLFLED